MSPRVKSSPFSSEWVVPADLYLLSEIKIARKYNPQEILEFKSGEVWNQELRK